MSSFLGGGGGGGLGAMMAQMAQSPGMQHLAQQLAGEEGLPGITDSDSEASDMEPPAGDAREVAGNPLQALMGGLPGGGGGSLAQMMSQLVQSPALRQMAEDPEVQRLAQGLTAGAGAGCVPIPSTACCASTLPHSKCVLQN